MARLIDLTLTLGSDRVSPVPGLIGVCMSPLQTHETHARSNTKLTLATHIGTHVDAPYHFHPDGTTVEDMALDRYMGPALLLDLRELARSRTPISISDLQQAGGALRCCHGQDKHPVHGMDGARVGERTLLLGRPIPEHGRSGVPGR